VLAHPIQLPNKVGATSKAQGQCQSYARIVLHLNLTADGQVFVQRREQFVDKDDINQDLNDMGGYELCHGKNFTPPYSEAHCSVGNRIRPDTPCLTRLEQMTYDEASSDCKARGGFLAKIGSMEEAKALQEFAGNQDLGIGLRDFSADGDWRFDDGTDANDAVRLFESAFGAEEKTHRRRRRAANDFRRDGCMMVSSRRRSGPVLRSLDCSAKANWVCQGNMSVSNQLDVNLNVKGDLKADEGAFCLWHADEPIDLLPNDEGKNFRNTDLQCDLQVSMGQRRHCEFNPNSRRRGLVPKRGDRHNGLNYPVLGSTIGWPEDQANMTFLNLNNADDQFHCHYTPNNNGLLRVYAMQHMFDRNYVGSLKRTCGCGFKHLAKLVSRCDCTRGGRADNNCAKWHGQQLINETKAIKHPVRCNNCNANSNL
jgi:hypothetical protein